MISMIKLLCLLTLYIAVETIAFVDGQTYNQTKSIYSDKLSTERYNNLVRPVQNQSEVIGIHVLFETVSIVDVDDVSQSFRCNGFVLFSWKDEIVPWNSDDYGGQKVIHPMPTDIWRPRVGIMNTLDDRDPFKDDHALLRVKNDGLVDWVPGNVFLCSCKLNLTNYPFDEQICFIMIAALQHSSDELQFLPTLPTVGKMFYTANGEWDLLGSDIASFSKDIGLEELPILQISFHIKRRPTIFLLNVVLPVVLLSFLNILVFIIPVESGEKISYGITVQLALAVYLSMVSEMLPRVSETLPTVMIYLFIIFILSLLTVVDTMVIVFLHHKVQVEDNNLHARNANSKSGLPRNCIRPESTTKIIKETKLTDDLTSMMSAESLTSFDTTPRVLKAVNIHYNPCGNKRTANKYRSIRKHIDFVSFTVFVTVWITLTLFFLLDISGILKVV